MSNFHAKRAIINLPQKSQKSQKSDSQSDWRKGYLNGRNRNVTEEWKNLQDLRNLHEYNHAAWPFCDLAFPIGADRWFRDFRVR